MHSAIVVINIPDNDQTEVRHPKWTSFLAAINRAPEPMLERLGEQEGVLQLAENVWQINFQENPGGLVRLISCAMHHELSYGILQLKDAPVWHPVAFHPKPI